MYVGCSYVEHVLVNERENMRCCSIEYKYPVQTSQTYIYGGILIAGFIVYFIVIFFSNPVRWPKIYNPADLYTSKFWGDASFCRRNSMSVIYNLRKKNSVIIYKHSNVFGYFIVLFLYVTWKLHHVTTNSRLEAAFFVVLPRSTLVL